MRHPLFSIHDTPQETVAHAQPAQIMELADALRQHGFTDLGWANGWGSGDPRSGPWDDAFSLSHHQRCLTLLGDYERREFYLVDSSD